MENSEEHRRIYRQMLYETKGINNYLSAAILDPAASPRSEDLDGFTWIYHDLSEKRRTFSGFSDSFRV